MAHTSPFSIAPSDEGNFFQFGKHRIMLDTASENALMNILTGRQHGVFKDAAGREWELNPDQDESGKFHLSPIGGQIVATISAPSVIALIDDLRAIILGAVPPHPRWR